MSDDLAQVIEAIAPHIAHIYELTLPEATSWTLTRMAEARVEYRAAGAPHGDRGSGLIAWLLGRYMLSRAVKQEPPA